MKRSSDEILFSIGIFKIIQHLHMSNTGASDPLHKNKEQRYLSYLKKRRDRWSNTNRPFDHLVRLLVSEVIYETENRNV